MWKNRSAGMKIQKEGKPTGDARVNKVYCSRKRCNLQSQAERADL